VTEASNSENAVRRDWAVTGAGTGRTWKMHPTVDRLSGANGERYRGHADDGSNSASACA
jgi:hypothetical protein